MFAHAQRIAIRHLVRKYEAYTHASREVDHDRSNLDNWVRLGFTARVLIGAQQAIGIELFTKDTLDEVACHAQARVDAANVQQLRQQAEAYNTHHLRLGERV